MQAEIQMILRSPPGRKGQGSSVRGLRSWGRVSAGTEGSRLGEAGEACSTTIPMGFLMDLPWKCIALLWKTSSKATHRRTNTA